MKFLAIKREELLKNISEEYSKKLPLSARRFADIGRFMPRGGSHNLRLFDPFPFYDVNAKGSYVEDLDGYRYIDFWQGHFANILGHNPPCVVDALREALRRGEGLQTGFPGCRQGELAELILSVIPAEKIRFTTSGTLATMYAIMLARAYTGRERVMKIGGGWHGAQPFALKGISSFQQGFTRVESAGLSTHTSGSIITTQFNNLEDLELQFRKHGEKTACFIVEPFIGAGGFIFADKVYLQKAQELAGDYGVLLIFDEVISGFRFCAGGLQSLYEVTPDLSILGKSIGGGMPVSAVAGRDDIMRLCIDGADNVRKVRFEGGTFSAHPAAMIAGITFLHHLIDNQNDIYPRIGAMGDRVRKEVEKIFHAYGFHVRCTGDGSRAGIPNSSMVGVQFLKKEVDRISAPEMIWDSDVNDYELREKAFKLAMLLEGVNTYHGWGAVSAVHREQEISSALEAVEHVAERWGKYLCSS